jgi:hypothetical protein
MVQSQRLKARSGGECWHQKGVERYDCTKDLAFGIYCAAIISIIMGLGLGFSAPRNKIRKKDPVILDICSKTLGQ